MPKIGQLVRYRNSDGEDTLAQIVALSKDCKTQIDDACPTCGHPLPRKLVDTHTDEKGQPLTDKSIVELVELAVQVIGKDERGNPIVERRIVGGRPAVPLAATVEERQKPNTWWPDVADEEV